MYIYSLQAIECDSHDLEVTNQHQEMASEQMIDHSDEEEESYQPSQRLRKLYKHVFK